MSIFDNFSQMMGNYGVPLYVLGQAGSVYARSRAAKAQLAAQQRLVEAERARQAGFGAQSRAVFNNETMPQFTPAAAEARRVAEQAKEEALAAPGQTPSKVFANYNASTGNASGQDSIATRLGEAMGKAKNYSTTGAKMRSYGSGVNVGNTLIDQSAQKLGRIGRDAEISRSMLPAELDYTAYTGRHARTTADILGGTGAIAGLFALTRGKKPAATGPNRTYTFGGSGGDMSNDYPMPV